MMGKAKLRKLNDFAEYVEEKIPSNEITLDKYITTDNLLQNKQGRTIANNLPPQTCPLTQYKKGDILISNIRPYLKKIWYADDNGGASTDVLVIRAIDPNLSKFVYSVLLQDDFYDYTMKASKGSKMPRGDKSHIMQYPIHQLSNPQRIGELFTALDDKIALNKRINDKLEAMAKRLYDYWFVQFDFPDENGRPYKSSGGKMVWNETLKREIPEGWEMKRIDEILDEFPSTKRYNTSEYLTEGQFPIIDQDSSTFIAGYTNDDSGLLRRFPAVLFGDHSTCVKFLNFEFCRGADGTQILYSNDHRINQYYLYLTIKEMNIPNPGYSRHFKYLKELPIIIPDLSLSNRYERIVKSFYKKKTNCDYEIVRLTSLRDRLLPLLMNGQVVVEGEL